MKVRCIPGRRAQAMRRVAAYCRVSTERSDQQESFETQHRAYTHCVEQQAGWVFAGIYHDEQSATSASRRPGFMCMVEDALSGKFDLLLVKSISRFSRNILDCQQYARRLREAGVEIHFECERLSTMDPSSEMLFSLMGAIAQDESRSISAHVRWSYQRRFELGIYHIGSHRILGYDDILGRLVPNDQGWIVALAFRLYAQGASLSGTAHALTRAGAHRLRSVRAFNASAVLAMLQNETYVGDKRLQKRPPVHFLTKRPDPSMPHRTFYLSDDHTPIVERQVFDIVQRRLAEHARARIAGINRRRADHHPFYGVLFCGCCGAPYKRRTFIDRAGASTKAWCCKERQKGKRGNGCTAPIMREPTLEAQIAAQMGWPLFDAQAFLRDVYEVDILMHSVTVKEREEHMEYAACFGGV